MVLRPATALKKVVVCTLFFFPGNRIQGLFFPMENIPNGIYKSVNFKRTFGYQILPKKTELKQLYLRYHNTVRSKFSFFRSFFGRIEDTKKSF